MPVVQGLASDKGEAMKEFLFTIRFLAVGGGIATGLAMHSLCLGLAAYSLLSYLGRIAEALEK